MRMHITYYYICRYMQVVCKYMLVTYHLHIAIRSDRCDFVEISPARTVATCYHPLNCNRVVRHHHVVTSHDGESRSHGPERRRARTKSRHRANPGSLCGVMAWSHVMTCYHVATRHMNARSAYAVLSQLSPAMPCSPCYTGLDQIHLCRAAETFREPTT